MSDLVTVVSELKPTFGGNLLLPSDDGYDEARRIHNGMVDKHPALIAQCRGVADIVDAVKLARSQNLEIAVAADLELGARGGFGVGELFDDVAPLGKLGLVDGPLAGGVGFVSVKNRFVIAHAVLSPW